MIMYNIKPRSAKRLQEVYQNAKVIPFDQQSKFIIMSDCHRGQGNTSDNFLQSQTLFFGALEYYLEKGFTYIELGDGDELWESRTTEQIIEAHSDAFWIMGKFYSQGRFHMLYGNHDIVKRKKSYLKKHYSSYYCSASDCHHPLFPGMEILEGLILEERETQRRILLLHGHQADPLNDTFWKLSRFLVRYVWRPLESIGFTAPTGAGIPHKTRTKVEKKLSAYADSKNLILIAGHTHRPVFPSPGKGRYFNDGSCVHPRCITAIEIEGGQITLVKWSVCTREDRTLYVERQALENPANLNEFYQT